MCRDSGVSFFLENLESDQPLTLRGQADRAEVRLVLLVRGPGEFLSLEPELKGLLLRSRESVRAVFASSLCRDSFLLRGW
jgi:hypothetical protein